ncbi:hypothetical protein Hanom_Chr00s000062g01618841 [Helianthus anomalus]
MLNSLLLSSLYVPSCLPSRISSYPTWYDVLLLIHICICGRDSTRFDLARFDSVRFGLCPVSRHSSVVRPRVRHAKHGEPRTVSRLHIIMTSS